MSEKKKPSFFLKENGSVVSKEWAYDSENKTYVPPIPQQMFLTKDEIVNDLICNRLDKKSIEEIERMHKEDVIMMHFTFGMWIRNSYALWVENNPYTKLEDAKADDFPDQVSHSILEMLWEKIQTAKKFNQSMKGI